MIIDTDNYPFKTGWYRGGEPMVDLGDNVTDGEVTVFAKLRCASDIILYLAVVDALCRNGNSPIHVFMPYVPGARQDRYQPGYPWTAAMFARMLPSYSNSFTVCDIHSKSALDTFVIDVVNELWFSSFIPELITVKYDGVLAADAGGRERATKIAEILGIDRVYQATKHRNPHTGELTTAEVPRMTGRVLIADDICEGGGTFTGIVDQSRAQGDNVDFDLYVTHGIFSRGFGYYNKYFKYIYTTDSWYHSTNEQWLGDPSIRVASLLPAYLKEFV